MKHMMNFLTLLLLSLSFSAHAEVPSHYFKIQTQFPSGSRTLGPEGLDYLTSDIKQELWRYQDSLTNQGIDLNSGYIVATQIIVTSRTDVRGDETANQILSEDRANSMAENVKSFFTQNQVEIGSDVLVYGLGEMDYDENSCRSQEKICTQVDAPYKKKKEGRDSLFDDLFGSDYDDEYEQQPTFQCDYVWDDGCLADQRQSDVAITLQFVVGERMAPQEPVDLLGTESSIQTLPPVEETVVVEELPPVEKPAAPVETPKVAPKVVPKKETAAPLPAPKPLEVKPVEQPAAPAETPAAPATPAVKKPTPLKLYGKPVTEGAN